MNFNWLFLKMAWIGYFFLKIIGQAMFCQDLFNVVPIVKVAGPIFLGMSYNWAFLKVI